MCRFRGEIVCSTQTLLSYSFDNQRCRVPRLCSCYAVHYYYTFVLDILVVDTGSLNSHTLEVTTAVVAMEFHNLTRNTTLCAVRMRPGVQRAEHWRIQHAAERPKLDA